VHVNHFNLFRHRSEGPEFLQRWLTDAVCNIAALSKSIQSNKNNEKAMRILFDEHKFSDTKIPFSAVAHDIMTGETVILKRGKILDAVIASTAIPGIFPPVVRGKKLLVDGFVLANIPVPELRAQGADFVISVELFEKALDGYKNGVELIYCVEAVKQKRMDGWAIAASDFHIVIDMSEFDASHFENYRVAIERGYKTTKAVIPQLLQKLEGAHV
jgi:NTE family protein